MRGCFNCKCLMQESGGTFRAGTVSRGKRHGILGLEASV